MAHDSRAVANEILKIGREKGISMSMMKLIKLVYFAHAWMLGLTGKPLCSDPVEAWPYGPVFRDLYNDLPYKGSQVITKLIETPFGGAYADSFSANEKAIISRIIDVYGNLDAFQLSDITHQLGTPWYQTQERKGNFSKIDNDLIKEYYEAKSKNVN